MAKTLRNNKIYKILIYWEALDNKDNIIHHQDFL